jgi:hypothetical protein
MQWLNKPQNAEGLNLFFSYSLLPYEGPLDYQDCPFPSDTSAHIHKRGNLRWCCDAK